MHLAKKDPTIYKATFSGLIIEAFGKLQTLDLTIEIEVYHHSVWPCVWASRPYTGRGESNWFGNSPEMVQKLVSTCFARQLTPWQAWHCGPFGTCAPKGPQLVQKRAKRTG